MHLKHVTLRNFRCFEKLEIELHPRLTVLVAENAGGKTAVLDGIARGLSPLLRHLSTPNQRLSGPRIEDLDMRLVSSAGRGNREQWRTCDFSQIAIETTDGLRWDVTKGTVADKGADQHVGQSALSGWARGIHEAISNGESLVRPVFAYYGTERGALSVPRRIHGCMTNYEYPTSALVDCIGARLNFREQVTWFAGAVAVEAGVNQGNQSEDWMSYPPLAVVSSSMVSMLRGKYGNPHFNKRHKLVVTENESGVDLEVEQMSQGYRSMLALAMDFGRRLALANGHLQSPNFDDPTWTAMYKYAQMWKPWAKDEGTMALMLDQALEQKMDARAAPALMLIDEVDLHLHPSWQQRVLTDLMRAFPCTQFIVTTHSPQVLSTVAKEYIRILRQTEESILVETPQVQTKGVESMDVLASIMCVSPVPPVAEARWLRDYRAAIETGDHETPAAQELHCKLVAHFGEKHPVMLDCARLLRFQAFKRRHDSAEKG